MVAYSLLVMTGFTVTCTVFVSEAEQLLTSVEVTVATTV